MHRGLLRVLELHRLPVKAKDSESCVKDDVYGRMMDDAAELQISYRNTFIDADVLAGICCKQLLSHGVIPRAKATPA